MNSPRNIFYGLMIVLVSSIFLGVGIFYSYDSNLQTINKDIGKLLATQELTNNQIEIYKNDQTKIDELSFVKDLSDSVLPPSKEQANLLAQIKKFIVDAGLGFESVSFNNSDNAANGVNLSQTVTEKALSGVRVLPLTASIKEGGTYSQVIDLLQTIESSQRKMHVTDLSLTPDDTGTKFSIISIKINVFLKDTSPKVGDENTSGV